MSVVAVLMCIGWSAVLLHGLASGVAAPALDVVVAILMWVPFGFHAIARIRMEEAMRVGYAVRAAERADRRQLEKLVAEWNRRLLGQNAWRARRRV